MLTGGHCLMVGLSFAIFLLPTSAPFAQMYSEKLLSAKHDRVYDNLFYTVTEDIPSHSPPQDWLASRRVQLDAPLIGTNPLDFHALGSTVTAPMQGLQFLDDLASVKVWLDEHSCERDQPLLANYLHKLSTQPVPSVDPVSAFGLRRSDLARDAFVNSVSRKYYTSAVWFILAHEVGHVALQHQGQPDGARSIMQEREADAFALETMRNRHVSPAGVVLVFVAFSFYDPPDGPRSHPLTPERVKAVADALADQPEDFVAPETAGKDQERQLVLHSAAVLREIAGSLQKIQAVRQAIAERGANIEDTYAQVFPALDLAHACPEGRRN